VLLLLRRSPGCWLFVNGEEAQKEERREQEPAKQRKNKNGDVIDRFVFV
jgi:hypothetical protein